MWMDIYKGEVVNTRKSNTFPVKSPRGKWVRAIYSSQSFDPITQIRVGPNTNIGEDLVTLTYDISDREGALGHKQDHLKELTRSKLDFYMGQIKAGYSPTEVESWSQQAVEAKLYVKDNTSTTILLDNILAEGDTLESLANSIIEKVDLFAELSGGFIKRRRELYALIDAASTLEELASIQSNDLDVGWS